MKHIRPSGVMRLRAAEVIEVCFPRIYKECPLRRTFDPLRCTSEAS